MMKMFGNIRILFLFLKIDHILKNKGFEFLISDLVLNAEKQPLRIYGEKKIRKVQKRINKSLKKIDYISTIYLRDAKCLHRVIAQYVLFRVYFCIPVKIIIGVKKFPFSSHIWLEYKEKKHMLVCEHEGNVVGYDVIFDSDKDIGRL